MKTFKDWVGLFSTLIFFYIITRIFFKDIFGIKERRRNKDKRNREAERNRNRMGVIHKRYN